jgi:hypothetical protein
MENFLYKCELCTAVRFSVVDKGEVWFISCGSCGNLQFHHKVVVVIHLTMGQIDRVYFHCAMDKEVEDDSKEKG